MNYWPVNRKVLQRIGIFANSQTVVYLLNCSYIEEKIMGYNYAVMFSRFYVRFTIDYLLAILFYKNILVYTTATSIRK